MLVKIKLNDIKGFRVQAIKELRELTGCGLKEAVDLFPSDLEPDTIIEVNADPSKVQQKFLNFTVLVPAVTLKGRLQSVIKQALDEQAYDMAIDLIRVLQRS